MGKRKLLNKVKKPSFLETIVMVFGIIAMSIALYYTLIRYKKVQFNWTF